jgi:rSAM/selenodomain-associated transferase 2/rSAM/selenodomain-associated transferase 1
MTAACRERLIIFTRYPEPGTTKTRMIAELGTEGAADLQRRMTEHIVARVVKLIGLRNMPVEIRYEGGSEQLMAAWLGHGFTYCPQGQGNIGLRMGRALEEAFGQGFETVIIVGSDIPDITTEILQNAFKMLDHIDLVLGPARDGGYYLIGVHCKSFQHWNPQLFDDISWGTESVLTQTLAIAERLGLTYRLLDMLNDVDRPEDLSVWYQASTPCPPSSNSIPLSIIIPTLNEADIIRETVAGIRQNKRTEIIVVDGGSQDGTADIAESLGAKVLRTSPSKAAQMNAGAAIAGGGLLLFLHADTRLPENFEECVLAAASQDGFCAGAFSLAIESQSKSLRLIEQIANWRSRFLQLPYGDQALFVSRGLFQEVGGYPDYPIMEDFELIRRLKQKGKITILAQSVRTSPRRWQNLGIFRTWLLNQLIIVAYFLGISPRRLAQWYRRGEGHSNLLTYR